jgi:hypothetical protein
VFTSILRTEAADFFKTVARIYYNIWCHIPEDLKLNNTYLHEDLSSRYGSVQSQSNTEDAREVIGLWDETGV